MNQIKFPESSLDGYYLQSRNKYVSSELVTDTKQSIDYPKQHNFEQPQSGKNVLSSFQ